MKRGLGLLTVILLALGVVLASSGAAVAAGPVQVTLPFTNLKYPAGVAVDRAGDVYVADISNNQVLELPAGSSTPQILPFTGLNQPVGVALDAAGDLFVLNLNSSQVLELPAGSSTQQVLPFTGLYEPTGIAVDAAGDVYVADANNNQVVELAAGSSSQQVLPFTGLYGPYGIAVDPAGDVYVEEPSDGQVVELPAGSSTQQILPFTGLGSPYGIAVDPAGDVYVVDSGNNRVVELPAGSSTQQVLPFTGLDYPEAIGVDAAGDVYVADGDNRQVVELSGYTATTTVVTSVRPATPVAGQPVTVAVSVTAASGALAPGGQVKVSDGSAGTCTATLAAGTGSSAGTGSGSCQLTETAAGPYTLTASYAGNGAFTASSGTASISVDATPAFITDTPPTAATAGQPYGYAFTASGTPAPAYALAAGAPSWLSIDASTGVLSGTVPTGTKSFSYAVTAANTAGTVTAGPFTVTVTPAAPPAADLSAALNCPRTLVTGATGTCTLTVHNAGPATASQVTAGLVLPAALAAITCSPGCTRVGNVLVWRQASLAAGATAADTATVRAGRPGTTLILGVAVSRTPDPQPRNNLTAVFITITR